MFVTLICLFLSNTSFNQDFRGNFKKSNFDRYLLPIAWAMADGYIY